LLRNSTCAPTHPRTHAYGQNHLCQCIIVIITTTTTVTIAVTIVITTIMNVHHA
jgi:hypothetical protein